MTTYYVNKEHGNDGQNGLTHATAWLTIDKALSTVSAAGNHTILVGDGVYAENSYGLGYLICERSFADWVTVQPELGAADDVTITNPTSATYLIRFVAGAYVRLKWLKIVATTPLTSSFGLICFVGAMCHHFEFIGLTMTVAGQASGQAWGVIYEGNGGYHDFLFDTCTIVQTGGLRATGIRFDSTGANAISNITITNCNIQVTDYAVQIYNNVTNVTINGGYYSSSRANLSAVLIWDDVTNVLIDGGTFIATGSGGLAVSLGVNGQTGDAVTGIVQNIIAQSTTGHALLIGAGCSNVQVLSNHIIGGDNGIVVKQNSGTILTSNVISGGTDNALYFKAADSPVASLNIISNTQGNCVKVGYDSANNDKCSAVNFQNNILKGTGTSRLFDWGDTTDDAGGSVCDHNHYSPRGTNKFGTVWGSADGLATLAALIAAWATYGDGSNDSHSLMWSPGKNFLIPSLALRR
jgi:hypothetical protein